MKLNLHLDLKKLVQDMKGPKGAEALTEDFNRISSELKKFSDDVRPQARMQLRKAEKRYHDLLKKLHMAQKDFDKEVARRVTIVKKQAKEVEKNLAQYKKLAIKQKAKLQSALGAQTQTASKKTTARKTTKKTSRPMKKTSKKAAGRSA